MKSVNPEYARKIRSAQQHARQTQRGGEDLHGEIQRLRRLDADPVFLAELERIERRSPMHANSHHSPNVAIRIPKLKRWKQISGDMDPGKYGALIARSDGDELELVEIQPVREHVGDGEAAEVGFPFWSETAYYDIDDLNPAREEVQRALESMDIDLEGGTGAAGDPVWTPENRALAIAEALMRYGYGGAEGPAGWSDDVVPGEVEWWSGVGGPEFIADEDDEFRRDILGEGEEDDDDEELESNTSRWRRTGWKSLRPVGGPAFAGVGSGSDLYAETISESHYGILQKDGRWWAVALDEMAPRPGESFDSPDAAANRAEHLNRNYIPNPGSAAQRWGFESNPARTFRIDGYRVVVSDGYRASVYQGRKKVGHWVIAVPSHISAMGLDDDRYVAEAAVEAARERGREPRPNPGRGSRGSSFQGGRGPNPDKFDIELDEMVYAIVASAGSDEETGGYAFGGTVALLKRNGADIVQALHDNPPGFAPRPLTRDERDFLMDEGSAGVIVFITSDGSAQVVYYDNERELEEDWAATARAHARAGEQLGSFSENPTRGVRGEQAAHAKFDHLRKRYTAARDKFDDTARELGHRYGHASGWEKWLKATEKRKLDRLRAAVDRERTKLLDHIASISPRDWNYGVPAHWVAEKLSYEDAVRPVHEPLSVVPPLGYGATTPRT